MKNKIFGKLIFAKIFSVETVYTYFEVGSMKDKWTSIEPPTTDIRRCQ